MEQATSRSLYSCIQTTLAIWTYQSVVFVYTFYIAVNNKNQTQLDIYSPHVRRVITLPNPKQPAVYKYVYIEYIYLYINKWFVVWF